MPYSVSMGRPPAYLPPRLTPDQRKEVLRAYIKYVEHNTDPHLAGFLSEDSLALKYWVNKQNILEDWPEFQPALKRAYVKEEAYILDAGQAKNTVFSIFRLKQASHGYKDKIEQDITTNNKVSFINAVPRPGKRKVEKQIYKPKGIKTA